VPRLHPRFRAHWFGVLVALAACRRGPAPNSGPPTLASAEGAKVKPAEVPATSSPKYRVFHVFPKDTRVWSLGSKLVACEQGCRLQPAGSPSPRTWLIHADHVEEDASLLPRIRPAILTHVRYVGGYPNEVHAILRSGADEDTTDDAYRYLGRGDGNRFVSASRPRDYNAPDWVPPQPKCREHCEPFDRFLQEKEERWQRQHGVPASAPQAMLFGQGGPALVIEREELWFWNDQSWVKSKAPWCSVSYGAVRLSTGASLIESIGLSGCEQTTQRDVFWISKAGKVHEIDLATPAQIRNLGDLHLTNALDQAGEVWLVAASESGTVILAPDNGSEMRWLQP
jgi:hypothetical protein